MSESASGEATGSSTDGNKDASETPATFLLNEDGYERWMLWDNGKTNYCSVHQLLAISEGADPHKIFSGGDYHVHHKNGIPWDNRAENLEVLTPTEHNDEHSYSKDELLSWLESYYLEFGHFPQNTELKSWPGPSRMPYWTTFGGMSNAKTVAARRMGLDPNDL